MPVPSVSSFLGACVLAALLHCLCRRPVQASRPHRLAIYPARAAWPSLARLISSPPLRHAPDMDSPFPRSASTAGSGQVVATLWPDGRCGLETMAYQYPLKLISPQPPPAQKSVLAFVLSYGGGLVGGDVITLSVRVEQGARLSIVTQGHTKIFKSPSAAVVTSQSMDVRVDRGAALCLLPDPVQPFEDSVYAQTQLFHLHPLASLCLLDWVTQGRKARGEDWSFIKWTGRNEIWLVSADDVSPDRQLIRDVVVLSQGDSLSLGRGLKGAMHGLAVFGSLFLRGPLTTHLEEFFLTEFEVLPRLGARDFRPPEVQEEEDRRRSEVERWRAQRVEMERRLGILWSAARVRGCTVVKFGAESVEAGRQWLGGMLLREGSILTHFGDQALMCVR